MFVRVITLSPLDNLLCIHRHIGFYHQIVQLKSTNIIFSPVSVVVDFCNGSVGSWVEIENGIGIWFLIVASWGSMPIKRFKKHIMNVCFGCSYSLLVKQYRPIFFIFLNIYTYIIHYLRFHTFDLLFIESVELLTIYNLPNVPVSTMLCYYDIICNSWMT